MEAPSPQIIEKLHDTIKNNKNETDKEVLTSRDIDTIIYQFNKEMKKGNYNLVKYNKYKINMNFSYKTAYYDVNDIKTDIKTTIINKITKYIEETIPADCVKVNIEVPDDICNDDDICANCVINTLCVCIPVICYHLPMFIYRHIDNRRMYINIEFNTIMPVNIVKIVD